MNEEAKDFLDEMDLDGPVEITTPATEKTEPVAGQPRDGNGRFAKAEGEQTVETPPAQPAAAAPPATTGEKPPGETSPPPSAPPAEAKMIPESALVAVRKDFQKKIEALERQLSERAPSAPPKPQAQEPPPPDMFEDPVGYRNWQTSQFEQRLQSSRLDTSEVIARQQHGDEKIDTALEALKASGDQAAWQHILKDRHPYGALLKWHEDHQVIGQIKEAGGLDALIAARVAEAIAKQAPQASAGQPQTTAPAQPVPPPSLAKGGAGNTAVAEPSDEEEFGAAFR